jgi:4-amino-4-deoxy-L-arabinose transferase-like glycosyltransferase
VIVLAGWLFSPRAGLLAGLVAAVYPEAVAMSTFVLSEAPFCPLMMLHLILWVLAWRAADRRRAAGWAVCGGLAAGLATLMRPSWLLFTPLGIGLSCLDFRRARRPARLGLWMMLGLVAAMSPWWIRNAQLTGTWVPTTLQVGESLYDGLSPVATGASDMAFVDTFRRELQAEDAAARESPRECFEQRLDRRMRAAALAWAASHPADVMRLAAVKFQRIWNVWPNESALRDWRFRVVVMVGYLPILVAAIGGLWRYGGRGWPYVLCVLPAVYFTGLHVVFVGSIRYRQPAMLPLIVLAAGFIAQWLERQPAAGTPDSGPESGSRLTASSSAGRSQAMDDAANFRMDT